MKRLLLVITIIVVGQSIGIAPARTETIIVLAAASTAAAMEKVINKFSAGPNNRVVGSYAGTSTLARQIESGAPADIFLSANLTWMTYLDSRQFILSGSRSIIASNRLVFFTPKSSSLRFRAVPSLDLIALLGGGRLAVGDPGHVPAGIYARQALETLGLWPVVQHHLAPAADVRAAMAVVSRGEAPLGIAYATDLSLMPELRVAAVIPDAFHETIVYPVGRIRDRPSVLADRFLAFLTGPEGREVFSEMGFAPH